MSTQYISEQASANSNDVRNAHSMYIDGNLGVGTTSPGQKVEVNGKIKSDGLILDVNALPPTSCIYVESGTNKLKFRDSSGNSHYLY